MTAHEQIWKYGIVPGEITIGIPAPAEIVSVGLQDNVVVAWVKVEPVRGLVQRLIIARQTGEPFKGNEGRFIGTGITDAQLVYHIYEGRYDEN